ncbi:hypothetical protein [Rubritalea sp.]|uniref:hypothetical protein n=1 Tax=Rubritalea sp. TaxID=2109375 RepID=UPI003EF269C0
MNNHTIIEESDSELYSNGFDNFLFGDRKTILSELKILESAYRSVKATNCAKAISEVISWIESTPKIAPIDLSEIDKKRFDEIWKHYQIASEEEQPCKLAVQAIDIPEDDVPTPANTDLFVIPVDLSLRINSRSITGVWDSLEQELGDINPSTRGSALETANKTKSYIYNRWGGPIEIQFMHADALKSSGEIGEKSVYELQKWFTNFFKVGEDVIKVTWENKLG